jgi:sec-independent protein translocase protein TatA
MPFRLGPWEIVLILAIILIVFGVGKLPQVASTLGKSVGAFRKAQRGKNDEVELESEGSKANETVRRWQNPGQE